MAELHTLALLFRGGQRQVNLVYSSKSAAETAYDTFLLTDCSFEVNDSFGTRVAVLSEGPLEAMILQESGHVLQGQTELSLLQARAQAKATSAAQHDPMLKLAQGARPGGFTL